MIQPLKEYLWPSFHVNAGYRLMYNLVITGKALIANDNFL